MNPWLISIPVAYLLGSVPFGYLLVRVFRKQDIRQSGSGNIGATNVARSGAKGLGLLTLLLDLLKGVAAVLIARHLAPGDYDLEVLAAVAVVAGHVFPVWLSFRGGKGVATALGVFLVLTLKASLCILLVFAVIVALTRFVSLASIIAAATFPVFSFLLVRPMTPITAAGFIAIPLVIILKHMGNIRRLLAGTESRFGSSVRKVAA